MNRLLLKLAMSMAVASLFCFTPAAAQVAPTTKKAASIKITQGPEIERADSYLTIVRWTTNKPWGIARALRSGALRHESQGSWSVSEISNQTEP